MSDCHDEQNSSSMAQTPHGADGALDRMLRLGQRPKYVPAIFIHAGAGFHSHQNERVHLEACNAAAEMGISFLKAGATATEAIEAALRILEDKEITNAGYGSNLSIDGTVECDATIVDHLGRSGACGAVPNVKNPISLAKLILDTSNKPLSLRRVPPNALVGEGARNFAEEHGMTTFANEYLVSKNARDRFLKWQDDLKRAEAKARTARLSQSAQAKLCYAPCQYETAAPQDPPQSFQRDHTAAIMAGTWNEGQPDSPYAGTPVSETSSAPDTPPAPGYFRSLGSASASASRSPTRAFAERLAVSPATGKSSETPSRRSRHQNKKTGAGKATDAARSSTKITEGMSEAHRDGSSSPQRLSNQEHANSQTSGGGHDDTKSPRGVKRPVNPTEEGDGVNRGAAKRPNRPDVEKEDFITDTIGAIAIDDRGHIAAGSSSGGIGMKHRGRLGPAALVGIGTAVVPYADDDAEGLTVAAVTSGTGEHMATTMASQRCAERIYRGTRQGMGGGDIHDDDEDAIMESFIADDFMGHPGVKSCHSAGAIGVMVVKKTGTGYYLYFAHNTDSFALASMGGAEKEPSCTMSRLSDGADIARGGRKIRLD